MDGGATENANHEKSSLTMYSNKENVNILTALLVAHGVRHAVVCPGSRNAPIVHDMDACPLISCYPVTDERSAGFYALGLSLSLQQPVAVCVTSGSALLNLAPAASEAFYQHVPVVFVSADRPAHQIDQLMGQTLPQPDALGRMVRKAVSLPEPKDRAERAYCIRLLNEAFVEMRRGEGGPVHINVPISEPLFSFDVPQLPDVPAIRLHRSGMSLEANDFLHELSGAERLLVCVGYSADARLRTLMREEMPFPVLSEVFGAGIAHIDEMLLRAGEEWNDYRPDTLIYIGGAFVSKRMKAFLQQAEGARVVLVNADGCVADPTMRCSDIVEAPAADALDCLIESARQRSFSQSYLRKWQRLAAEVDARIASCSPVFSSFSAVKMLGEAAPDEVLHVANSSSVRLALSLHRTPLFVNRGVNGIEGSLSTAAGYSLAGGRTLCIVGDLSFFYDQNALWNRNLHGNLRILLLNNSGGSIFRMLPGLEQSPACEALVMAQHGTDARGICEQNGASYRCVRCAEELPEAIGWLLHAGGERPFVLEVQTDAAVDERVLREFYNHITR